MTKKQYIPVEARNYRQYVGPEEGYDLMAAQQFNLLTTNGLRQHHMVCDIGCGSLRLGRLLIPYLLAGRYYGIEPNKWLVREGLEKETGLDIQKVKRPRFSYTEDMLIDKFGPVKFDYVIAQSIYSHASQEQIITSLQSVYDNLTDTGQFFATFKFGKTDYEGSKWVYPGCVTYTRRWVIKTIKEAGFMVRQYNDIQHPGQQTWMRMTKPKK